MTSLRVAYIWSIAYVWFADTAYACSVCGYTTGESRFAFIATTVFLTVMPLAFIASVVYFLIRKKTK